MYATRLVQRGNPSSLHTQSFKLSCLAFLRSIEIQTSTCQPAGQPRVSHDATDALIEASGSGSLRPAIEGSLGDGTSHVTEMAG